jgi:hypothetical protein
MPDRSTPIPISAGQVPDPLHYSLLYLSPRRGHNHVLRASASPSSYPSALCGIRPDWTMSWMGTGSQEERDEVTRRGLCRNCRANVAHWVDGPAEIR